MFLAKLKYQRKMRRIKLLYWCLNRWNLRQKLDKFISQMELTRPILFYHGKARQIQKRWKLHVWYIRFRDMVVRRMQSNYRMIRVQNESFKKALELNFSGKQDAIISEKLSERDIFSFKGPSNYNANDSLEMNVYQSVQNPLHYKNVPKRLYFSQPQLTILENIGLTKFFKRIDVSTEFALRRNFVYNICEHRQSPIMSLISCSMNMVQAVKAKKVPKKLKSHAQTPSTNKVRSPNSIKETLHFKRQSTSSKNIIFSPEAKVEVSSNLKRQLSVESTDGLPLSHRYKSQKSLKSSQKYKSGDSKRRSVVNARKSISIKSIKKDAEKLEPIIPAYLNVLPPTLQPKNVKHKRKRKNIQEVMAMPQIDNQTALISVTFENDTQFARVFRAIMKYNRFHDDIILVFYEPWLIKFRAQERLQRWLKGELSRTLQKPIFENNRPQLRKGALAQPSITIENTLYSHYAILNRVARKVQKAFRQRSLKVRIDSLINIAKYAANINSNVLYLEQSMYLNLKKMREAANGNSLKQQQKGQAKIIVNTQIQNQIQQKKSNQSVSFYDRRFLFEVSPKDFNLRIMFPHNVDIFGRYTEHNLPLWFTRIVDAEIPKIVTTGDKKRIQKFRGLVMSLIHIQPFPINSGAPIVQNYHEICVNQAKELGYLKFVKVELPTIEEAKNRAVCLALLTANTYMGSDTFVRFYTGSDLNDADYLKRCIKNNWKMQKTSEVGKNQVLAPTDMTERQQHGGIVRKKDEPYKSILRAKPKPKPSHFERFIVLGDADTKHVEERLGNALLSQQVISKIFESRAASGTASNDLKSQSQKNFLKYQEAKYGLNTKLTLPEGMMQQNAQPDQNHKVTPGDIAKQKYLLQENRIKALKIQQLEEKLQRLRQTVQQHARADDQFKFLFVQQLLPLLRSEGRKSETDTNTLVYEMPRITMDFNQGSDGSLFGLETEQLEHKIENLYKDYQRQKQAYRRALQIYEAKNHEQKREPVNQIEKSQQRFMNRLQIKKSETQPYPEAVKSPRVIVSKRQSQESKISLVQPNQDGMIAPGVITRTATDQVFSRYLQNAKDQQLAKREMSGLIKNNRNLKAKNQLLRNAQLIQPISPGKELKGLKYPTKNQDSRNKHILHQIRLRKSHDMNSSLTKEQYSISTSIKTQRESLLNGNNHAKSTGVLKDAASHIKREKDPNKLSIFPQNSTSLPNLQQNAKQVSTTVMQKGSPKRERSWLSPLRVRNDSLMGSGSYHIEGIDTRKIASHGYPKEMNINMITAMGYKKKISSAHRKNQKSELFQSAKIQTEFDDPIHIRGEDLQLQDSSYDSKNEEEFIRTKTEQIMSDFNMIKQSRQQQSSNAKTVEQLPRQKSERHKLEQIKATLSPQPERHHTPIKDMLQNLIDKKKPLIPSAFKHNSMRKPTQTLIQAPRTIAQGLNHKSISMKRLTGPTNTIEKIVQVRLQKRVSHAGLFNAVNSSSQANFNKKAILTQQNIGKTGDYLYQDKHSARKTQLFTEIDIQDSIEQLKTQTRPSQQNRLPLLKAPISKAGRFDSEQP